MANTISLQLNLFNTDTKGTEPVVHFTLYFTLLRANESDFG